MDAHPNTNPRIALPATWLQPDYALQYADVLSKHPNRPAAIAELCLFRFWLACSAYWEPRNADTATENHAICPAIPAGWTPPRHASGYCIAQALDGWLELLTASRFDLYTCFFRFGRHPEDPQGLRAAALALSCQLFEDPSHTIRQRLSEDTHRLFASFLQRLHTRASHGQP